MTHNHRRNRRRTGFPLLYLGVSLVVHLLGLGFLAAVDFHPPARTVPTIVEIDPALLDELAHRITQQVVESEKARNQQPPKETKYLGERNQSVEEETKAATVDSFRAGQPKSGQKLSLKQLSPVQDMFKTSPDGLQPKPKKQPENTGERGGLQSATSDYLEDVKQGNQTLLNTKEFIYFGYYHRIRQRLERSWNSELRSAILSYVRSGRRLASERNYVTRLVVVLDRHGRIRRVSVLEESGARDLDDAAVEAFNRAGPFPNPPRGLVDKNGLIKIRWDFILQS